MKNSFLIFFSISEFFLLSSCTRETASEKAVSALLIPQAHIAIMGPSDVAPGTTVTYLADFTGFHYPIKISIASDNPAVTVSPATQYLEIPLGSFAFNVIAAQSSVGTRVKISVKGDDSKISSVWAESSFLASVTSHPSDNQLPYIKMASLSPVAILPTRTSVLTASAIDPENGTLSYEIKGLLPVMAQFNTENESKDRGRVVSGNIAHRFISSSETPAGFYPFSLEVRDSLGGTIQKSGFVIGLIHPEPRILATKISASVSAVTMTGPTFLGLFTDGVFKATVTKGRVDFSGARWFVDPPSIHSNKPAGQVLHVKPNDSTAFSVTLSVPDLKKPGQYVTSQFGPVRVLVGSNHFIHLETDRIDQSQDIGCHTLAVSAPSGGVIFLKNIGDPAKGCVGHSLHFSFDFIASAMNCSVDLCPLTVEILRTDKGGAVNLKVTKMSSDGTSSTAHVVEKTAKLTRSVIEIPNPALVE